jgi:serine O-acetyltransferase
MHQIIKEDLYRYVPKQYSMLTLLRGLRAQGFRYMFFLRLAALTKSSILRLIYRLLLRRYLYKYGFQIPYNAKIGAGFFIGHFGTIVINSTVIIGKNCNISPGVTVGQTNRGANMGAPILGDRVWIGTNAMIVGKISVGNDVLIAPGAYVNFDVPDHSIVIGNPGRITKKENATQDYVCNVYEDR